MRIEPGVGEPRIYQFVLTKENLVFLFLIGTKFWKIISLWTLKFSEALNTPQQQQQQQRQQQHHRYKRTQHFDHKERSEHQLPRRLCIAGREKGCCGKLPASTWQGGLHLSCEKVFKIQSNSKNICLAKVFEIKERIETSLILALPQKSNLLSKLYMHAHSI